MILLKPEWGEKNAEDIWALYYFLLFQVLPFSPFDYLPMDESGCYYYEKGNRTTDRIHPKKPNKELKLETSIYELIRSISSDLCDYLYVDDKTVNRDHLRELFTTSVDADSLKSKQLSFSLNISQNENHSQENAWAPLLKHIFNYNAFRSQPLFPKLIKLLGVEVCPYCNRNFTTTAILCDEKYHRQNQVDHYIPKATHPWFALSLLNFIPSCANCNQKKGEDSSFLLYPYYDEFGASYRFRTVPLSGVGYLLGEPNTENTFQIEIQQVPGTVLEENYKKRAEHSISKFGLDALYRDSHNSYVKGILEQRFLVSDAYLDNLCSSFPNHFRTRQDARRMLYLKKYNNDELDKEPLSKLTHDIDSEINDLIR